MSGNGQEISLRRVLCLFLAFLDCGAALPFFWTAALFRRFVSIVFQQKCKKTKVTSRPTRQPKRKSKMRSTIRKRSKRRIRSKNRTQCRAPLDLTLALALTPVPNPNPPPSLALLRSRWARSLKQSGGKAPQSKKAKKRQSPAEGPTPLYQKGTRNFKVSCRKKTRAFGNFGPISSPQLWRGLPPVVAWSPDHATTGVPIWERTPSKRCYASATKKLRRLKKSRTMMPAPASCAADS